MFTRADLVHCLVTLRPPSPATPHHSKDGAILEDIRCRRHPEEAGPPVAKPPFKSELGTRIQREICNSCWQDWLQHQTVLMNHYGLDPRDKKAKDFLYAQLHAVLFDEGEVADVDTSKEGTIDW